MVQNLGFIVTFFDVLGHMFDCTIYPRTAEQAPLSSLRIKNPIGIWDFLYVYLKSLCSYMPVSIDDIFCYRQIRNSHRSHAVYF